MKISLNDLKPVLISMKTLKISCSSQQNFLLKNSLEFIKTTAVPLKFQNNQFNRTYILSDGSSFKIKSMLLNHMGMKIPFSDKSSLIFLATSHDSSPIGGKIIKNISLENDSNLKQITHPIKNVNCPIEITNDDMNEFCKIDDSYCNVIRPFKNLEGTKAQEAYMSMIKTGLHVLVYSNFYYKTTGELPFTKLISNGTDILNRAILMHLTASEVPDIQNIEKLSEISKLSKTPLNYSNEDAVAWQTLLKDLEFANFDELSTLLEQGNYAEYEKLLNSSASNVCNHLILTESKVSDSINEYFTHFK